MALRRHVLYAHLPWFVSPTTACWACKKGFPAVNTRDHHRRTDPNCRGTEKEFGESGHKDWLIKMAALLTKLRIVYGQDSYDGLWKKAKLECSKWKSAGEVSELDSVLLESLERWIGAQGSGKFAVFPTVSRIGCLGHWRVIWALWWPLTEDQRVEIMAAVETGGVDFSRWGWSTLVDDIDNSHCHLLKWAEQTGLPANSVGNPKEGYPALRHVVSSCCWPRKWDKIPEGLSHHGTSQIWWAIGVHPNVVARSTVSTDVWSKLEELLERPDCCALGEVGLDYYRIKDEEGRNRQRRFLTEAGMLAERLKKPMVLHMRGEDGNKDLVHQEGIEILKRVLSRNAKIQLHCFQGSLEVVERWSGVFENTFFSIGPAIIHGDPEMERVVKRVESRALLVETDSPFLAGFKCPFEVSKIFYRLCTMKNIPPSVMRRVMRGNFERMFLSDRQTPQQ